MESLHAPSLPYGPFSFEVTKQTVLDDRTIYQYEFERVPPVRFTWAHRCDQGPSVSSCEAAMS